MKNIVSLLAVLLLTFAAQAQSSKYRCMVQLTNYKGLEAYVVVSLINPEGKYEKTLYMLGPDKQWYNGFKEWDKALGKKKENLSAITGASVAAGDRTMVTLSLDDSKLNKGYKLRFETAVEDQNYHISDVEIPLTTEEITVRKEGNGYIRYVKLNKQ